MHEVFNMGTGFCCIVAEHDRDAALELVRRHYAQAAKIGEVTAEAGVVRIPGAALVGSSAGFSSAAA